MNMQILVHIGLLYLLLKLKSFTLTVLELNFPKEIRKFIEHKNIKTNIFRIQSDNSIMCGYFCIGFIDFMFAGKTLIDHTSLFSCYDLKIKMIG